MNVDPRDNACISAGKNSCIGTAFLVCAVLGLTPTAWAQQCAPHWNPDVGQPGMDAFVFAMAVFDDGSGPSLYAGGQFESAGGQVARGLARWDGSTWSEPGGGVEVRSPNSNSSVTSVLYVASI